MQPIVDELLTRWQEAPHTPPEDLCREHPELLPVVRDRIGILKQIERLAAGDVAVPFVPYAPALHSRKARLDN
jgi:hypothetical protein